MKKVILLGMSFVLVAAVAIGGTLAYLTDTDSDINVMTMGNVRIEQIEQEWNEGETELVNFTQAKPLLPYVGEFGWENRDEASGAYRRFTMNNVVDKYVSVKNTGITDAYVRTFIALEMGDYSYEDFNMIGVSINKTDGQEFPGLHWNWTDDFVAEIGGKNYNIMVAVYDKELLPGETTIPSLLQVYLSKDATNETVEKLDGNDNGTYDIFVYSEAVQADGFEQVGSVAALNTAFGDTSAPTHYHPWSVKAEVATADDLTKAIQDGADVITLTANITADVTIPEGETVVLNLNGCSLNATTIDDAGKPGVAITNSGNLILTGEGSIRTRNIMNYGNLVVDGDITVTGGWSSGGSAIWNEGDVVINNGTFVQDVTNTSNYAVKNATENTSIVINGGTFKGYHGAVGAEGGTLVINGGDFTCIGCSFTNSDHCVYAGGDAVVEINGGTFTGTDETAAGDSIVCGDSSVAVVVNGGTFISKGCSDTLGAVTVKGGDWN